MSNDLTPEAINKSDHQTKRQLLRILMPRHHVSIHAAIGLFVDEATNSKRVRGENEIVVQNRKKDLGSSGKKEHLLRPLRSLSSDRLGRFETGAFELAPV
jgi:hypothetical protein